MNDHPYTTADEDPFNVQPIVKLIKHPHSTLLDKWIIEQQQNPAEHRDTLKPSNAYASFSNPYLAYPDLPRVKSFDITEKDDGASIISYDLIDDNDIPANVAPQDAAPQVNIFCSTDKSLIFLLLGSFHSPPCAHDQES